MLRDIYCFKKQAAEDGRAEGPAEGEQKGKLESKQKIAKKLKEKNMAIDEIIEITELSKEEIEKL